MFPGVPLAPRRKTHRVQSDEGWRSSREGPPFGRALHAGLFRAVHPKCSWEDCAGASRSFKNNPAREGGLTGGEVKSAAGDWWVENPPPDNAPGRWWVARAREPDQAVNFWSGSSVAPLAGSSEASFPSVLARVWPCQNRGSPQILEEVPWLPWRRVRSKARAGSKITNRTVELRQPHPEPAKARGGLPHTTTSPRRSDDPTFPRPEPSTAGLRTTRPRRSSRHPWP